MLHADINVIHVVWVSNLHFGSSRPQIAGSSHDDGKLCMVLNRIVELSPTTTADVVESRGCVPIDYAVSGGHASRIIEEEVADGKRRSGNTESLGATWGKPFGLELCDSIVCHASENMTSSCLTASAVGTSVSSVVETRTSSPKQAEDHGGTPPSAVLYDSTLRRGCGCSGHDWNWHSLVLALCVLLKGC